MLGALFVFQDRKPLAFNVERFLRGASEMPPKLCTQFEDVVKRVEHAQLQSSSDEQAMQMLRITSVSDYHLLLLRCGLETFTQAGQAVKDNEAAFRIICSEALREWVYNEVQYWKLDGEDLLITIFDSDQDFLNAYMELWRNSKRSPLYY